MRVEPITCYRPRPESVAEFVSPPYDVFDRAGAAAYVAEHPSSFLAIDRPETAFPPEHDMYADDVYQKAHDLLAERVADGTLLRDGTPCFYLYRLVRNGRAQTGVVAACSFDDYNNGIIRRHELTRRSKEDDRARHIEATGCQTGPIFLAYRDNPVLEALIEAYPGCGLYCTGFSVVADDGLFPAPGLERRGVVDNFFRDSAHRYIAIPSACCIPRAVFDDVGGFPEGMKMAGDLYMWIKIARRYRVCYSPERLARYSKVASNRSATSYTPERTRYSFEELYDPSAPEEEREFFARAALGKALIQSVKGGTEEARRAARFFHWTRVYRRTLHKVQLLNRLPVRWRGPLLDLYNAAAWRLARKGL